MAEKKGRGRPSGQHKTPRRPVMLPGGWLGVLQELASRRPTPAVWYLVELLKRDAEANGMTDLPPTPWARPTSDAG